MICEWSIWNEGQKPRCLENFLFLGKFFQCLESVSGGSHLLSIENGIKEHSSASTDALYNLWGPKTQRVCVLERVTKVQESPGFLLIWRFCRKTHKFPSLTPGLLKENIQHRAPKIQWHLCTQKFEKWCSINVRKYLFKILWLCKSRLMFTGSSTDRRLLTL